MIPIPDRVTALSAMTTGPLCCKAYQLKHMPMFSEHAYQNIWGPSCLSSNLGIRPDRSCTDSQFSLALFASWPGTYTKPCSCVCYLTKAFDCVDRTMAWHILLSRGCAQVGGAHQGLAHRQLSHHQSRAGLIFSPNRLASSKAVIWHRVCSS